MYELNDKYLFDISIIIITYNSSNYISKCIRSILEFQKSFTIEIIIIDNNSSDKTVKIIQETNQKINLLVNNINLGFSKACNQGINLAEGKYIFLLNPDTIILNDVFGIFYDFMKRKENELVWCVGAQLVDENNGFCTSSGQFPNFLNVISQQIGLTGVLLKMKHPKSTNSIKPFEAQTLVPFVLGCNMFIRKSYLDTIGLFNELFFLNYEETELSWRAYNEGYKSFVLPEAKIMHYSGKSITDLELSKKYLWLGQLIYFKLTRNRFIFNIIKFTHLLGSTLRLIIKFDFTYFQHLKKILSI